ncbi:OsmC family protein [Photobacterium lutimaris]|uniref:Peroxiredoxin n=1 Tax=Photobacterium lutimaris TaxID=388278 RepID=A0A2T3J4S8_9GAMM|nr:OsmC family protein [Photobacterium lutimaris]PSU36276.1 peroxiredoxin [Photobacterium lutimaris]TDR74841.1 OsmC-like protein [Photobacterium lutimaris]
MIEFGSEISWRRSQHEPFIDNQFHRSHQWRFDGGETITASASHHIVPQPCSTPDYVDPEEAFIAALSSCHMMAFLTIAAKRKYIVDKYNDEAFGMLEEEGGGRSSITKVTLRPAIQFSGSRVPSRDVLEKMHHVAHENCFIANSVKTTITVDIIEC